MKKRKYTKPLIEVHMLDKDISLVMMTSPPIDPDPPFPAAASPSGPPSTRTLKSGTPFEGNTPNYK